MTTNRKQIRLKKYDYTQSGYYFVTLCTQNRECLFGEIVDGKMILNDVGDIVNTQWNGLLNRFHNIELDEFVVMPNHFHGILIIRSNNGRNGGSDNGRDNGSDNPTPTSLGQIIAYFKYESTKKINQYYARARKPRPNIVGAGILPPHSIKKIFQRNYYEHIIRNENDLFAIRKYIEENPQ